MILGHTIKDYKRENLLHDVITGIIIMAVSIPISMGYSQIAGLPAVYGLYGSVFPIILFALFSTSPQFIFGVDAAPAALVGSALLGMNIQSGSKEALAVVPVITFFVALWLLAFYLMHAGKLVNYISAPVMGGFITGICSTIILMQVPKLMGGTAGTGELLELLEHIEKTAEQINLPSLILGILSLVILLAAKKIMPKFPMAVVMMAAGAVLTQVLPMKEWGIKTLDAVAPGLPKWSFPNLMLIPMDEVVTISLSVAVVIMAETLLAENNFAQKNGYRINDNQELLAFAVGNLVAALTGCCPINGSVSRTAMGEQYQGKTQLMSIVAGLSMILLLLFGTGFIGYLPVPVLTAIVISALLGATEFELAVKLWKVSRTECFIFWGAFIGVLLLGTINGVLIGIILSFAEMVIRSSKPASCFLGIQPGHKHFRDLAESRQIHEIEGVLIYRFSSNLFFANAGVLQQDIEQELERRGNIKAVILDASGIGSMDITAADRIEILYKSLKEQGIRFYITEHIADLNEQMRKLGIGHLIKEGAVRRTILAALHDAGIEQPCPLDIPEEDLEKLKRREYFSLPAEEENTLEEFAWAFGDDAVKEIEKRVLSIVKQIHEITDLEKLSEEGIKEKLEFWNSLGALDEDELLRRMELHLDDLPSDVKENKKLVIELIERRRRKLRDRLLKEHPEIVEHIEERRERLERRLEKQNPDAVKRLKHWKDEEF